MSRLHRRLAIVLPLACFALWPAFGQLGGSRAGLESYSTGVQELPPLDKEVAERYITIEGRVETRVRPTDLRMVLAITGEGETAGECQRLIQGKVERLRTAWLKLGLPPESIVEDFIAILPVYAWSLEERGGEKLGIEKKTGFRMQTNIHLAVPNDSTVQKALAAAFEQDITDIIAFDYWSRELDEVKVEVRKLALEAARGKSDVMLGALFNDRPPLINVQEETTVRYPESLYHSFVSAHEEGVVPAWNRDLPFIRAYRPRNTYYRGLDSDSDVQAGGLPMDPEISVVSSVRLYFQSPGAKNAEHD